MAGRSKAPNRFKRQRVASTERLTTGQELGTEDYLSEAFVADSGHGIKNKGTRFFDAKKDDPDRGRVLSKKEIHRKMEETREEGLQQKIGQDNAGFKLLMKLGYKGDGGLGKDRTGSMQPIMPVLKQGRAGLGKDSEIRKKAEDAKERRRREKELRASREVQRREGFRLSKAQEWEERQAVREVRKARRLVESLDVKEGRERSVMWPTEDDEAEEGVEEDPGHREQQGGTDGVEAMGLAGGGKEGEEGEAEALGKGGRDVFRDEWEAMDVGDQLLACLTYLREHHLYCMYCGHAFADKQDMEAACPGVGAEDHDESELGDQF